MLIGHKSQQKSRQIYVRYKKEQGDEDQLPVKSVPWGKEMKGLITIPFSEPTLTQSTAGDIHGVGSTQMRESQREVQSASFDADNPSSL